MTAASDSYAVAFVRASCVNGVVRLFWLENAPYFDAHPERRATEFSRVRILRKDVGMIDERHAACCMPFGLDGAECVYDGPVARSATGSYEWTERVPESPVSTVNYVYGIATAWVDAIELIPVAARNPDMWWTYDTLMQRLAALCAAYPHAAALTACGQTVSGRAIPRLQIGARGPALGLVGLIHAGESGPELMVPVLERLLAEERDLFSRVRVIAVPAVNIDQRERMVRGAPYYLRVNAAGTDINRNFPAGWEEVATDYGLSSDDPGSVTYRGVAPASSPETQAVMAALDEPGLRVVFSYHWMHSICALPALSCRAGRDDAAYMAECRRWVEAYAAGLYAGRAYEPWFHDAGTSAGSLPTWLYETRRIPAFDCEGGTISCGYGTRDHSPFDVAMLADYRERHFRAIRSILVRLAE